MDFTSLLGLFPTLILQLSMTSGIVSSENDLQAEWKNVTQFENKRQKRNTISIKDIVRQTKHDQYERNNAVPKNNTALMEWLSLYSGLSPVNGHTKRSNRRRSRVKRSLVTSQCAHGDLCSHSLCPWDVYEDEKSGRVPMVIKFAVCRSSQCNYDFANLGKRQKNKLKLHSECSTLYEDFIVLEEEGQTLMIDWPIACVCSKKRTLSTVSSSNREYLSSVDLLVDDRQRDPLLGSSARVHDVHTDHIEETSRPRQRPSQESVVRDYENLSADTIHAQHAMLRDLDVHYTRRPSYRLLRHYGNILPTQSWEERMEEIMNST